MQRLEYIVIRLFFLSIDSLLPNLSWPTPSQGSDGGHDPLP